MDTRLDDGPWLIAQYTGGRALDSIADELGVARLTVRRRLVRLSVRIRGSAEWMRDTPKSPEQRAKMAASRALYWNRQGNRAAFRMKVSYSKIGDRPAKHRLGYRSVIDLTKPRGTILEHRYVMEQALGRKLLPNENIHHRNGDRSDNRLSNLELWAHGQPPGQRVRDRLAWAREIIALYGDLPDEVR